jgi:hypothetical protein
MQTPRKPWSHRRYWWDVLRIKEDWEDWNTYWAYFS